MTKKKRVMTNPNNKGVLYEHGCKSSVQDKKAMNHLPTTVGPCEPITGQIRSVESLHDCAQITKWSGG
jgi:hypothetical protein